ncbi:MAG TPA: hypothetical protein VFN11_15120 [Ktedonobacterales bacterium]|nr:hypothetical protein [Ktedonobacterales bacterium]
MPNNIPAGGGNVDFTGLLEGVSALQRNPQVGRLSVTGVITATFSASTLYGYIIDSGSVTLNSGSAGGAFIAKLSGPSVGEFSFGAPIGNPPPGSGIVATVSTSTVNATIWYK